MSVKDTGQGPVAIYRLVNVKRNIVTTNTLNNLFVLMNITEVWHRRLCQGVRQRNLGFDLLAESQGLFIGSGRVQRLNPI